MPEHKIGPWIGKLEAEISRELGQPVTLSAGGPTPETGGALADLLDIPGARLLVVVEREHLAAILIAGRVIEEGQADAETVRELWSGILASVAGRLGGTSAQAAADIPMPDAACALHLGSATMRMALGVEASGDVPAEQHRQGDLGTRPAGNYDLLLDVELDASVRFGSRELQLKELLELGPGDVVELDRHVSDPVDLIVGDKIVAHGEVVLVNGNFGLRITDVAEPVRRLESIRCLM